jgi:uncharacterized protein YbjT (DUF2867 family)
MTRRPESYEGAGEAVQADVQDTRSLAAAVRGCDAAYYLVHSLDKASFEKTMRPRLAPSGVRRRAQLRRIIYLGGLGNDDDELSRHLRSRREVQKLLADAAIGEEVFFRGALFEAVDDRRRGVSPSTAVYSLVITATRNPALVLASGIMGTLFARQRRATGGIQAPTLTHVTWSMLMLRFLPPLFRPVDGACTQRRAGRPAAGSGSC